MATLFALGAMIFGQISDRVGRTRTTKVAIAGTAGCTLGIALVPDFRTPGAATIAPGSWVTTGPSDCGPRSW